MSITVYELDIKTLRARRVFNPFIKYMIRPLRKLKCRRPANVDRILNRNQYQSYK